MKDTYIDGKVASYLIKLLANEDLIELRQCNVLLLQAKNTMENTFVFSTSSTTLGTKMSCINFKESDKLINVIEEEN
jgi:hypothetical protein